MIRGTVNAIVDSLWFVEFVLVLVSGSFLMGLQHLIFIGGEIPHRKQRRAIDWLLLFIPPAVVCAIMIIALTLPNGEKWFYVQILMICAVPLGVANVAAAFIIAYLFRESIIRRWAVSFLEGPIIFLIWQMLFVPITGGH